MGSEMCIRDSTIPARQSQTAQWPEWADETLVEYLHEQGVSVPWSHQVETASHAHAGRDVVVATGTASGKSLGYQLAALSDLATASTATALYIAPTKALAQDQRAALARMCAGAANLNDIMVATMMSFRFAAPAHIRASAARWSCASAFVGAI